MPTTFVFRGEVTCMACSRFLGEIEGRPGMKAVEAEVTHPQGKDLVSRTADGLHCAVCGGRAMVVDLRKVAA